MDDQTKPKKPRGNPALVKGAVPANMGRKKGTQNKLSKFIEQKVAETGLTPLEFMTIIYRADAEKLKEYGVAKKFITPLFRLRAAESAAPYVHRKMPIAIEGSLPGDPIAVVVAAFPKDPKLAADAYRKLIGGKD